MLRYARWPNQAPPCPLLPPTREILPYQPVATLAICISRLHSTSGFQLLCRKHPVFTPFVFTRLLVFDSRR